MYLQAGPFCLIILFLPMTWCLDISWVSNGKSLPLSKSVTCNVLTTTLLAPQMFALCSRKYRESLANLCAAVERSDGRYHSFICRFAWQHVLSPNHRVLKKFSQTKAADVRRVIVGSVLAFALTVAHLSGKRVDSCRSCRTPAKVPAWATMRAG